MAIRLHESLHFRKAINMFQEAKVAYTEADLTERIPPINVWIAKKPHIFRVTDKIKDQSTGTFQPIQRSNAASASNDDDDPDASSGSEWGESDADSQPRRGKRLRTN